MIHVITYNSKSKIEATVGTAEMVTLSDYSTFTRQQLKDSQEKNQDYWSQNQEGEGR